MGSPRVSVVVPAYNCARYLPEAIGSVLEQTFVDWELIVVDDGSTDETLAIAHRFAAENPRISVLTHPGGANLGAPKTRNRGIDAARGELIAFLDADDVWVPEKLERQVEIMDHHPDVGFTYGQAQAVDTEGHPIPPLPGVGRTGILGRGTPGVDTSPYEGFVDLQNIAPTSSVLVRTELISRLGGFHQDFPHGQDRLMWMRLATATPAYFHPERLVLFRKRRDSHSAGRTRLEGGDTQLSVVLTLASEHGTSDPALRRRARSSLVHYATSHGTPMAVRLGRCRRAVTALLAAPEFSTRDVLGILTSAFREISRRVLAWMWRRARRGPCRSEDTPPRARYGGSRPPR